MTDDMGDIRAIRIEDEMRVSYLDYAMSVIVARALPDVRDGLKPVHRRILYTMGEMGLSATSSYRKCAAIVGEVMGKYHPHGDVALYDALVRLAQDFSMRYPLVDGQGNFGSVDGDTAAAMRYTEARLTAIAGRDAGRHRQGDGRLRRQLRRHASSSRRSCRPSCPNLLINGSSGIAVGMATNIPPHHLGEIVRRHDRPHRRPASSPPTTCAGTSPGPDFPTGGTIFRFETRRNAITGERETVDAIREMYAHGRGRVVMRAQVAFEEVTRRPDRDHRHRAALPGEQGGAAREDRRAGQGQARSRASPTCATSRTATGCASTSSSSATPTRTRCSTTCSSTRRCSRVQPEHARARRRPAADAAAQGVLQHYIDHRREIVRRRTEFDLGKARARAHILEGLKIALDNLDAVIKTIRESADVEPPARTS